MAATITIAAIHLNSFIVPPRIENAAAKAMFGR
jgi:hypothetical protein